MCEGFQRNGIFNGEYTAGGADQSAQVCASAERFSQIMRQTADIGTGAANDFKIKFRRFKIAHGQRGDVDRTWLQFDFYTLACQFIEFAPALLDGAVDGGTLQNITDKRRQRRFYLLAGDVTGIMSGSDIAFGIIGGRRLTQPHPRHIALGGIHHIFAQAGGTAHAHHQHTRRQRIKRPGMADLPGLQGAAHLRDDIMARHAERLIDIQETNRSVIGVIRWHQESSSIRSADIQ